MKCGSHSEQSDTRFPSLFSFAILFVVIEIFYFYFFIWVWWLWWWWLILAMVVVVDDFDSGFVDFGCGGGG